MKTVRVLFFAVVLLSTVLLLAACFNANMYPDATSATTTAPITTEPVTTAPTTTGEVTTAPVTTSEVTTAPTTTAEVTTAPVTTAEVTTAPTTTAPTTTATPNPIKEVRTMANGNVRLTYEDGKTQFLGTADLREGYNPVSVTVVSLEEGILTLRLSDTASENVAEQFLGTAPADRTFRLREAAGNLEWANALGDRWQVLCPYKLSARDKAVLVQLCEAAEFGKTPTVTGDGVTVVIDGNIFGVRAHHWVKDGYDLINTATIHSPGHNHNMLLSTLYEVPSSLPAANTCAPGDSYMFKTMGDEIPSININNTYIAAAHGYNLISAVPNTFGLTLADIGRVFTRGTQKYMLVKLPGYDAKNGDGTAWFCPFDATAMSDGNFGKYSYGSQGKLMANDVVYFDDGIESFRIPADASLVQFHISTNHVTQHAYLNGTTEISLDTNGVYEADFVDFYERYDVTYLPAVLNYLAANVGKNDNDSHRSDEIEEAYLSFIFTHRFHKNGSFTVYQTVEIKHAVKDLFYYGVMSMPFGTYIYAPGATNIGAGPTLQIVEKTVIDEKTGEEKTEKITTYAEGSWRIRSFYQFTDTVGTKGMNVGYYPYFGVATDAVRPTVLGSKTDVQAGEWSPARKMYPYLLYNQNPTAGTSYSFIGYHVPTMKIDDDFFAVNWYFVGDEIYLTMHTDHAVAEKTVALPNSDYLVGLTVTVDEASDGFTVHSTEITAEGITVSTTGGGYVTVKLTKTDS